MACCPAPSAGSGTWPDPPVTPVTSARSEEPREDPRQRSDRPPRPGHRYVGLRYLIDPLAAAPTFGLPAWPDAQAAGFSNVKGIRDLVSGLIPLMLLVTGQHRALGWALVVASLTPFGDAVIMLAHGGSTMAALTATRRRVRI
ncbi:DUF4267 domain-containing protein [Streptosporangium sp. NPDC000396]|uniref:DUF4267 domain-containing protein n=1 Tax=Streptosporangium sp. NPDC000396 TaxID=3366185 RepID=UPI00368F03A8